MTKLAAVNDSGSMGAGEQSPRQTSEAAMKERGPGPIWGGWWFWEPPPGKVKEDKAPERKSLAEILAKSPGFTESDKDIPRPSCPDATRRISRR